jgi:ubiquinone/menaquinone biosynthesis C-methylase UbiE
MRLPRTSLRDRIPVSEALRPEMRIYFDRDRVEWFRTFTELFPGEHEFLRDLGRSRARRLLDVGVGAGRTARQFAELSYEYVGTDFSSAMVETCRARFPQFRFEVGDVRDLSRFADGDRALHPLLQ